MQQAHHPPQPGNGAWQHRSGLPPPPPPPLHPVDLLPPPRAASVPPPGCEDSDGELAHAKEVEVEVEAEVEVEGEGEGEVEVPPSRQLWVGNVTHETTEAALGDMFGQFGKVEHMAVYPQRNYAFVVFRATESAKKAKDELQGRMVGGSPLRIEYAKPAKPSKCLWIGGICPSVTKEQLESELITFGPLEELRFLRDRNSAIAEYQNIDNAVVAVEGLNQKRMGDGELRVDFLRSQNTKREAGSGSHQHQLPGDPRISNSGRSGAEISRGPQQPYGRFQASAAGEGNAAMQGGDQKIEGDPCEVLWIGFPSTLVVDEERLRRAFILFGEIDRIKMFPGRSFCFVQFRNVDEARRAKEGLQGRLFNDPRVQIRFSKNDMGPSHTSHVDGPSAPSVVRGDCPGVRPTLLGGFDGYCNRSPKNMNAFQHNHLGRILPHTGRDIGPGPLGGFNNTLPRMMDPGYDSWNSMDGINGPPHPMMVQPGPSSRLVRMEPEPWNLSSEDQIQRNFKRSKFMPPLDSSDERVHEVETHNGRVQTGPSDNRFYTEKAFDRDDNGPQPRFEKAFERDENGPRPRFEKAFERDDNGPRPRYEKPFERDDNRPRFEKGFERDDNVPRPRFENFFDRDDNGPRPRFDKAFERDDNGLRPRFGGMESSQVWGSANSRQGMMPFQPATEGPVHEQRPSSDQWKWQGVIAKAGTFVCRALSLPVGEGIDSFPSNILNCFARTSLDMLAEHLYQAVSYSCVFFMPDGENESQNYQEFLRYLGERNRAGVAKLSDGATIFLVPPSEFSERVLKLHGHYLFGVVPKFAQPSNHHLPARNAPIVDTTAMQKPYQQPLYMHHPGHEFETQNGPVGIRGPPGLDALSQVPALPEPPKDPDSEKHHNPTQGSGPFHPDIPRNFPPVVAIQPVLAGTQITSDAASSLLPAPPPPPPPPSANPDSEAEKQNRFQATLQLAAALLQRMQQPDNAMGQ